MKKMVKVCHLTSVHARYDTRIFIKECCGLAKNGFDTYLVVADGKRAEVKNNVQISDVGKESNKIARILFTPKKILKKALEIDADIYHFHDPELLLIASRLLKNNKKVIYDAHEDLPRQILDKPYIPLPFRKLASRLLENFENKVVSKISGVVTVTPDIQARFLENNDKVIEVRNFPKIEEFKPNSSLQKKKDNAVCYVGGISKIRGVLNMVDAMANSYEIKLFLGGKFESNDLREKVIKSDGWTQVDELGFLGRNKVVEILQQSVAGLVVLEPTASYLKSIPVKMFEYMIAGIPVIASDFKYWRELIEDVDCALFVDPLNPQEIGAAIQILVEDKKRAHEMGSRGQRAVLERFNWSVEEKKLIEFYQNII